MVGTDDVEDHVGLPQAARGPPGHLRVALVDDHLVPVLHHAEPRVEPEVVAGVEGVGAELVAHDVGGDALDLAAGGERVAQLHGESCSGRC